MEEHFFDHHNNRTRHSTNLIQCSFSSLSNSLEINFFIYFFDFLKGFYWKEIFWTIINTIPVIKPLKEVQKKWIEKCVSRELNNEKMSTGPSSYYNGYGSYDCPKKFLSIKPLKGVKKILMNKCVSRELDNEENEHRTKFLGWRVD